MNRILTKLIRINLSNESFSECFRLISVSELHAIKYENAMKNYENENSPFVKRNPLIVDGARTFRSANEEESNWLSRRRKEGISSISLEFNLLSEM